MPGNAKTRTMGTNHNNTRKYLIRFDKCRPNAANIWAPMAIIITNSTTFGKTWTEFDTIRPVSAKLGLQVAQIEQRLAKLNQAWPIRKKFGKLRPKFATSGQSRQGPTDTWRSC